MANTLQLNGYILAAGLGTRLRPITNNIPKALVKVAGKEAIIYQIEALKRVGVQEIVINTHHFADKIQSLLGDGKDWQVKIHYSHEQELLGSAGGVKHGARLFSRPYPTVVLSCDVISNADLTKVIAFHRKCVAEMTLAVLHRQDVSGAGIVAFDKKGLINRFCEKPTNDDEIFSHWVNGSIYVIEPSILNLIPDGFMDFSRDIFPLLIAKRAKFYAYKLPAGENYLLGIDTAELLAKIEKDILAGRVFTRTKSPD